MSKNITIEQDGIAQNYTGIMRVRTNGNSGTDEWLPQDELNTMLKSITKNGTYRASDDGVYGYYAVYANVKASSVTGKDKQTGQKYKVMTDMNGNIIKIPVD